MLSNFTCDLRGCPDVLVCPSATVARNFFRGGSSSSFVVETFLRTFGAGVFEVKALGVGLDLLAGLLLASEPLQRLSLQHTLASRTCFRFPKLP